MPDSWTTALSFLQKIDILSRSGEMEPLAGELLKSVAVGRQAAYLLVHVVDFLPVSFHLAPLLSQFDTSTDPAYDIVLTQKAQVYESPSSETYRILHETLVRSDPQLMKGFADFAHVLASDFVPGFTPGFVPDPSME